MDMHLLHGLGFEFDSEEEIEIKAIANCLNPEDEDEDSLFGDESLYNYEDHFEDPE